MYQKQTKGGFVVIAVNKEVKECDVLVVGGGIAGLMAAIAAADQTPRSLRHWTTNQEAYTICYECPTHIQQRTADSGFSQRRCT